MSQVCDTGIETLSLKLGNSGPALVHQIPKSHEEIQVTSTDWKLAKTKTKNATSYDHYNFVFNICRLSGLWTCIKLWQAEFLYTGT